MQITSQSVKALRDEIDAALAAIAEKHGVTIHAGNAKFTNTTIDFKLQVASKGDDGVAETEERKMLKAMHPDLVDAVVAGGRFKVIGYKRKARKNPFVAIEQFTGKTFVLPAYMVGK